MEIARLRKHKIMDILVMQYRGYDEVGCTTRDIYNFCHLYKQETVTAGDAQAVICHMMARQERDPNFFFNYLVDGEGHLKGLFWADSQSRLDYEVFGNVVVFDSTYRTNKYNLPFVPFVGLNHHHSTVVFGCGIISHETSESYKWMLRTFSTAMAQKHPISVITNGDLAMQRVIRVVWPDTIHRLWSTNAASNCTMIEILDADNLITYVVAKKDRREKKFQVDCEVKEGILQEERLPKCCVPTRWTMSAKAAFPKTRKNNLYDYSARKTESSLQRLRQGAQRQVGASTDASGNVISDTDKICMQLFLDI
ncbi:protein FAR1-RELATED SEQUENCE 5-like [Brachypodium distachyon]|uniref:protein FAR1-RELATED SEQUENCE 5-like n=1 Tax=Brachypodium distachyon TaxID=15368 RepID=UPI00052FF71C|nr:protein FAR1-RELATED SEQUENCE 5-like [Brachypodium distachyon]|eukprot:XP_010233328.1 protein FAR1-RELATED SEQUENCE 5-like [Brachypodium distachyon]